MSKLIQFFNLFINNIIIKYLVVSKKAFQFSRANYSFEYIFIDSNKDGFIYFILNISFW